VYASGSDGMVYCLDAADGKEIWKTKAAKRGGVVHSSPVLADGRLWANVNRRIRMISAEPGGYAASVKGGPKLADYTSPAISDGKLYIRDAKAVFCYDLNASANPPAAPKEQPKEK